MLGEAETRQSFSAARGDKKIGYRPVGLLVRMNIRFASV